MASVPTTSLMPVVFLVPLFPTFPLSLSLVQGGSTTMIFGGLSDNILLLILQKLEELYKETIAGRTDSKLANR